MTYVIYLYEYVRVIIIPVLTTICYPDMQAPQDAYDACMLISICERPFTASGFFHATQYYLGAHADFQVSKEKDGGERRFVAEHTQAVQPHAPK